jgi:hypothetical protein
MAGTPIFVVDEMRAGRSVSLGGGHQFDPVLGRLLHGLA